MTDRTELQKGIVADLREQADLLKHSIATWQLLARAANEIERLQAELDKHRSPEPASIGGIPIWKPWY